MTIASRALSRLALLSIMPVMAAALPVAAAAAGKAVAKAAPTPVAATKDIIPLPLNPILPAGQRLCAEKAASGLGYTTLRPATGAKPAETDVVLVNYIGYLAATGQVFDQSMQAAFPVNGVIPGFSQGLQMLARGGIIRFCIPAAMGYGAEGSGASIPPNSDLVFQVELVDYKTAAEVEQMRKASGAEQSQSGSAPPPQ
jgi:FKBP-type peptidyl-prolyl cis-trans isomerase FkpA